MALFGFDREPRDRSAVGYTFHALIDNLGRFLALGAICVLSLAPGITGAVLGALWGRPQILLLSGIAGGAIFAPFYAGLVDAAVQAVRGLPGRWWERYRRVVRREWRGCLLPGMAMGLVAAMSVNVAANLRPGADGTGGSVPAMMLPAVLIAVLAALAAATYFWPQKLLLDLKNSELLKNSGLMVMLHPVLTLGAVALQLCYAGLLLILFPYSILFILLLGVWFPTFFSVRIVYGALDQELKLDERLDES